MTPNYALQERLRTISNILIYCVFAIAVYSLTGMTFFFELFIKTNFQGVIINPLAAVLFILVGVSLLILNSGNNSPKQVFIGKSIAVIINIISIGLIIRYLFSFDLGLDKILFTSKFNSGHFFRLSLPTAFSFLLEGIALLLIRQNTLKSKIITQTLSLIIGLIGSFLLLSYLYKANDLLNVFTPSPTSFFATIAHLFIAFIIFFANPGDFLAGEISKTKTGSKVLFIFLPIATLLPVLFFWLHQNYNYASGLQGIVLSVILFIIISILILYYCIRLINVNINQLLDTQTALKDSLKKVEHLSGLVMLSTDAIITTDTNSLITSWNKGAENIYGYTADEVMGKNKYEILDAPFVTPEQYNERVKTLIQVGEMRENRMRKNKSGTVITVSHVSVVNKDAKGNITGFIGIGKDITQLVKAESELAAINYSLDEQVKIKTKELSSIYDRISDAVVSLNNNWEYTYLNKKGEEFFKNITSTEVSVIGKNVWETFPFLVGSETDMAYKWSAFNQETFRVEINYKQFNIWTEQTIYPSKEGITVFLRDITQQKIAEIKQRETEERYKNIVETAQEGVLVSDENSVILFVNDYFTKIVNENKENIIGKPVSAFFDVQDNQKIDTHLEKRKSGIVENYEFDLKLKDGIVKTVSVTGSPLYNNGIFSGSLAMFNDITERKQIEKELLRTNKLYNVLSRLTRLLVNIDSQQKFFEDACNILIELSNDFSLVWIGQHNNEEHKVDLICAAGESVGFASHLKIKLNETDSTHGMIAQTISRGLHYICNDYFSDPNTSLWQEPALQYGFAAVAMFPLKLNVNVWGSLNVYSSSKDYFKESEVQLFDKIAEVISIGLTKLEYEGIKNKRDHELLVAKEEWERTFNSIPDYIAILDNHHNIVRANNAMAEMLNLTTESIIGQKCYTLMHGKDCPIGGCPHTALMEDGKMHSANIFEKTLGAHLDVTTSPIIDKDGNVLGSVHIARDVSEQKKADRKIKQLADINEFSAAFVGMANVDKQILYFNQSARLALDLEATEDINNYYVNDFHTTKSSENLFNTVIPILKERGIWSGVSEWISRKGRIIPVLQVIICHYDHYGILEFTSTTAIDITEIKNKEEELKKLADDLRSLSNSLITAREEERKAVAKEIHDELGQNLTILKLDVAWILNHIQTDDIILSEKLQQFKSITEDTVQTSRRLYNSLYPQMLDDVGLVGAITWHANNYLKPSGIDFELQTNLKEGVLPELHDIWLVLYRVYQECITNVLRYSKANSVIVELYIRNNIISLVILDDGIGFEIDKVDTKLHHGLLGMRERVNAVNGRLSIDSEPGKGTSTTASIPIPD